MTFRAFWGFQAQSEGKASRSQVWPKMPKPKVPQSSEVKVGLWQASEVKIGLWQVKLKRPASSENRKLDG